MNTNATDEVKPVEAEPKAANPCCGTTEEAQAAGACCGPSAKAEAVASGASCCG